MVQRISFVSLALSLAVGVAAAQQRPVTGKVVSSGTSAPVAGASVTVFGTPIGAVTNGMAAIDALNGQYGEAPSQDAIQLDGNAYLERNYPRLDYIQAARIAQEWR